MSRIFVRDTLLPLLVFPALSYFAAKFTLGHLDASGLAAYLSSQCSPSSNGVFQSSPHTLAYTGIPSLDSQLCGFVAFFHEAMSKADSLIFLQYFISAGSIFVLVPAVEGYRTNRSLFIAFPVIFGLVSQVFTIGATIPLYWLVFFLSGGRAQFDKATPITRAHAEAVIFGLLTGAAVPSICMLTVQDSTVTAMWQLYPIYVSVAAFIHLVFRPSSRFPESGFSIIQVLYLAMFVVASSIHFAVIWPRLSDGAALKAFFVPSLTPLSNADVPMKVMDFLKWDFAFGLLSMSIAQFWFVPDLVEIPFILFWYAIAVPFCGPGAAVIAANLWREGQIGDRNAITKEKQS